MANFDITKLLNIIDIMGWAIVILGALCLVLIVVAVVIGLVIRREEDGK